MSPYGPECLLYQFILKVSYLLKKSSLIQRVQVILYSYLGFLKVNLFAKLFCP